MSNKKYLPRSMPVITRESYNIEKSPVLPNWMDEFAANLEKQSVQSQSKANKSIYDQISSIMGGKSKYSSVEAAVEDMKERSGMNEFLNKIKSEGTKENGVPKIAQNVEIKLFKEIPQLKNTIQNYLEDTRGNIALPAIIERLKSIYRNDVLNEADWDDENLLNYINNKNIEIKKQFSSNLSSEYGLGRLPHYTDEEIDPSNVDAFHSLMPNVISK